LAQALGSKVALGVLRMDSGSLADHAQRV